jgi:hypothetical protein
LPRKPHGPTARIASPMLLAVLASLTVAACGGSSKSPTTASTKTSAAATTPATTPATTTATTASTPAKTSTTPSKTTTTPAASPKVAIASLRACLSAHGINLPNTGSTPLALLRAAAKLPPGVSRSRYQSVVRACVGAQLPSSGRTVKPARVTNPRVVQALRQFAACMRQHQVNLPEPNTSGKGPVFDTKGINTSSPQFRTALVACSATLRNLLRASPGRAGASPLG